MGRSTRPTATRMRGIAVSTDITTMRKSETLHQQTLCVHHHLIPAHSHRVAIKLLTTTRCVRKKGRERENRERDRDRERDRERERHRERNHDRERERDRGEYSDYRDTREAPPIISD